MAITLYLTGAFHEDGWSDMVDGFGGGWGKAQILAIMKDSRIGSFGAVALVMLLLAKFCALVEIDLLADPGWRCWPVTRSPASRRRRCCAASTMCATKARRSRWPRASAAANSALPAFTALLPLLLLPPLAALLGSLFAALATLWLARLFRQQIGGYTGDCLGATQQLSEVAFYCGLLCNFS
jgi:adenosylcobinamide-GDP ribazoletransferase